MYQSKKPKILVVEDEPQMCKSIQALLNMHGFDAQIRMDLSSARNSLNGNTYDLALLDIELKGQCGFVLMDDLIKERMDTGVIVVTGQHSEHYAITALKKGATDYLKKPFDPDELIESVNNVLKRQRKQRKLELLDQTVKSSSAGIAIGISCGEIVFTNPAYQQLANNGDCNGLLHDSNKVEGDVPVDEEICQALKTGISWRGNAEIVDSQGNPRTVYKLVDPIPEKVGGETHGVSLICCDITSRIQRERAVTKSRERYRKVIDSQRDFLYRLNSDLLLTFVNQTYASFRGKTPRSMIGLPITDVAPESIHPLLLNALESVRSGSRPIETELMVADDGKGVHWQHWRFEGIYNKEGRLTELQGVGRDVTGNKQFEKEIERNKEKFRNLAELTSDWLWEIDNKGVFSYTNPVVYNLLGYTPEEVLGKSAFSFMPEKEARRLRTLFENALYKGKPLKNVENINICKCGSQVTLETSGVPIYNEVGGIAGFRGINRDVSVRKHNESRLKKESEELKQTLARVKRLSGILPICSSCKKIRDEKGSWIQIEKFIENSTDAEFSHGICPECARKLYPELYE